MKKKLKKLAILMAVACLGLTGCGSSDNKASVTSGSAAQGSATANIILHQDPPKLDPRNSTAFVERHVFQSVFDKLVDIDEKGGIKPMLAEKWEITDDGKKYTLHLKKGVKFHDGTAFNAEAVKFNLERYKEKTSSRKNELKNIKEVVVVNDDTVELILDNAFAPLMSILADRSGMMCSPEAVKKAGDNFMAAPIGSGPYKFKSRIKGDSIALEKNAEYWQGAPGLAALNYKIINDANVALVNLKSGQVDMTNRFPLNEVNNYQNDPKVNVINEAGPGFRGIVLNTSNEKFSDKKVRQAIEKAIDREVIVKVALSGVGTPGRTALPSNNFAYDEIDKPLKPNLEEAKTLMKSAGKENGFDFTLSIDVDPVSQQNAQLIQRMLKEININMNIEKQDFGTLLDKATKGNVQAAMISWSGRMDPDQNLYDWVYTGARMNYMKYSNPQVDAWLDEARAMVDTGERKKTYKQIMSQLIEDMPYIYLYHEHNAFGLGKDIKGFKANPDGMIRTATMSK